MNNVIINALNNLQDTTIFVTDHIGRKYPRLCAEREGEFTCSRPKILLNQIVKSNDIASLFELGYILTSGKMQFDGLDVLQMYNTVVKGISEIVNTDISKLGIPKIICDDILESRDILNIKNQVRIVNIISSVFGKSKVILLKTVQKDFQTGEYMCYYIRDGALILADQNFIDEQNHLFVLQPIYVDEKYIEENGLGKKPNSGNCGGIPLGQIIVGESVTHPGYYVCLSMSYSLKQLYGSPYSNDGDIYSDDWLDLT